MDIAGASSPIQSPDFLVARLGLLDGRSALSVHVMGRRARGWLNNTDLADVSGYLDTSQSRNNPILLGTEYFIRSTSVNDTNAGGSGVRTVRVVYLDADRNQQVMTVALNGTTGVSLGNAIAYVQWMESATTGVGTTAAGDITISSVAGAPTVAQIISMIPAANNRSQDARYMIPTGYTGYLHTWDIACIGQNQDMRIRATVFSDDRTPSPVFHMQDNFFIAGNTGQSNLDLHWRKCPAGTEIKVSSIPTAAQAGNRADASFHILLVRGG